jgi:hypothetical protein
LETEDRVARLRSDPQSRTLDEDSRLHRASTNEAPGPRAIRLSKTEQTGQGRSGPAGDGGLVPRGSSGRVQ